MQRIGTTKSFAQHQHSNRGKAILLFKCCAAHRHNKIICTAQAQQSRESDDAMQVLCSASAQQNHSHNTSTALQGKKVVLFKCCATHRHNKILLCDCYAHHNLLCTAFAQQKIEVGVGNACLLYHERQSSSLVFHVFFSRFFFHVFFS